MATYYDGPEPEATLPKWQRINTRGFEIESTPRELAKASASTSVLPFEISVTSDSLILAAGDVDGVGQAEITEASPADGPWFAEAKIVINPATGEITARSVQWSPISSADTSTDFYFTIGLVGVTGGTPSGASIIQYTYGPILAILHGAPTNVWAAQLF